MEATARKTFRQQWDEYGSRPPVARWVSRFSYAVLGPLVLVAVIVGAVWLVIALT